MKIENKIFFFGLFAFLLSINSKSIAQSSQRSSADTKKPEAPKLSYAFKLNAINFIYNPFYYNDNAFFIAYPSPALLVKDFRGNTHEFELNQFTFNRYGKDAYYNDIAVLYQYDARLTKAKDLKLTPIISPYLIAGFASIGGSDSAKGRYFTNEFYAKLGLGIGLRYNVSEKTFIDIIPSVKLTHFYWLSGRLASLPQPVALEPQNQLLRFELKDVFFKVGLGHWF